MIVLDASAAVSGLLNAGTARRLMADEQLHAPHLVDVEVVSALRRGVAAGRVASEAAQAALAAWRRLGLTRSAVLPHLERLWELRADVSAYDAAYVALAEQLGYSLVTADGRLSRAPGLRCPVTVVAG